MKRIMLITVILFIPSIYSMDLGSVQPKKVEEQKKADQDINIVLMHNNQVIERQLFSVKLLNESNMMRKLALPQASKPIQLNSTSMYGISLPELHQVMYVLSTVDNNEGKEKAALAFLNNLPNKIEYPYMGGVFSSAERQKHTRERKKIELKNRELKYEPAIKAISFMQMARYLEIPVLESACITMLANYLSINNYDNGIPFELPNPYRKNFLDRLFSLPIELQNKVSKLFLQDARHSGALINMLNRFFVEKTTKRINHSAEILNFDWSSDSKYLFYVNNPRWSPWSPKFKSKKEFEDYIATKSTLYCWDSLIDQTSAVNRKPEYNFTFDFQTENITTAKAPDGKYVANFGSDNKISIVDAQTNQILETFVFLNQPKKKYEISKLSWSPDSTKLAVGNYNREYSVWAGEAKVYFVYLLFQLRQEIFSCSFDQLFFVIELLNAQANKDGQFKAWSSNKIVLKPEQQAKFNVLPEGLRRILKEKIAQYNPKGNYYY